MKINEHDQARPIQTMRWGYHPINLLLGFHGKHVDFEWRPYADRTPDERADFDRLLVDVWHRGVLAPVITHHGHVLVGKRRVEILARIAPRRIIMAVEIIENVAEWTREDVRERWAALRSSLPTVEY